MELSIKKVIFIRKPMFNLFLLFYFFVIYIHGFKIEISSWGFVWESRGAVRVRKDFLDMLKSQMWRKIWRIFTS